MIDIRIHFTENGVILPDDTCLGVQNEHKAARLVLILPESMVTGVTHHVVSFRQADKILNTQPITTEPNSEGAYREGLTIYQPLTRDLTRSRTLSLRVLAMTKIGTVDVIQDSTEPAQGLWFIAADGEGAAVVQDKERQLEHFHLLASHNAYEIETDAELYEFPCSEIQKGERIRLRNNCRKSFGFSPGFVPELNRIYRAVYFPPDLQGLYELYDGRFLRTPTSVRDRWEENISFLRSNGRGAYVRFYWHSTIHAYVVEVSMNIEGDDWVYRYVPQDCEYVAPRTHPELNHTLYAGWNRENTVDGAMVYEKCGPPPAVFDAKCTLLTVTLPEELEAEEDNNLMLAPFLISIEIPFEIYTPAGVYTRLGNGLVDLEECSWRPCVYRIRADDDAWSYGFQTVHIPGISPNDVPFPLYLGKELGYDTTHPFPAVYGLRLVDVSFGTATFQKTTGYKLQRDETFVGSLFRIYGGRAPAFYNMSFLHVHNYTREVVTPPTCTEAGYTTKYCDSCDSCDSTAITEGEAALGHDWGEWVITQEPTDEVNGVKTRTCTRCGETETAGVLPTVADEPYDPIPIGDLFGGGNDGE